MIYEFNCQTCGKFKRSVRSNKDKPPRFCSHKCRGCTKKFQWSKLSIEEKKQHAKRIYESHVIKNENGCWGWNAGLDKNGYAVVPISSKATNVPRKAHRISWWIEFGDIPSNKIICHHCDNPVCSRPDHLFLGTPHSNMQDKVNKGRHEPSKGSKNGTAILDEEKVKTIKKMIFEKHKDELIAKKFGVHRSTILNIKYNTQWKHVPWPKSTPTLDEI